MTLSRRVGLALLALSVLGAGCAAPINQQLRKPFDGVAGYRYDTLSKDGNGDDLFVILAFSGGGTRAAAFSYGVMEGLREARYTGGRALLDDVDVISSVSGGSFTAAYYALFRDTMFTDEGRDLYLREKIQFQNDLIVRALWPGSWFRLLSPGFDRIDLAAELYDQEIFGGKTFSDLMGKKPYLILNATDMSIGRRFEFTQDQFDQLCSDVGSVKVATGVAASSAFPGLLSPLTLKNYAADGCGYRAPDWLEVARDQRNPPRRRQRARDFASYQEDKARRFIHLLDGGLADNIGLRGPYAALTSGDSGWSVQQKINQGIVKRVVVLTANAKTKPRTTWDEHRSAPGVLSVLGFVTTGPMDNYSFDSVQLITDHFKAQRESFSDHTACRDLVATCTSPTLALAGKRRPVDFHAIEISFDGFFGTPENDHLRRCLEELPTTFKLKQDQVELLRQAGRHLVFVSADFNRAMTAVDKDWKVRSAPIEPALIARACPTAR